GAGARHHRVRPPGAAGGARGLGLGHERRTDAAPPALRQAGQAINATAPAVPAGDDGAHEASLLLAREQRVRMLANDPLEGGQRVGRARDRLGAAPQLEHLRALVQPALADRQRHAGTTSRASSSIAARSSMSSVWSMTRATPTFSQRLSSSTRRAGSP